MVRRIESGITYVPGAMALSASCYDDPNKIYLVNKLLGMDLKKLGFDLDFAPVADVNNNPLNPVINSRSYADDPEVVAKYCTLSAKALQDGGILPTLKHFPGHGDTNVDSHLGLPIVSKTIEDLKKCEFIPFEKSIKENIDGIMISHILYSSIDENLPASLSYQIITKLLKEKMNFKGLIITDSLTMAAIWQKYSIPEIVYHGIMAGNDILMFCGKADINEQLEIIKAFQTLVKDKKISISRINESVTKILKLKQKYLNNNNINIINNINNEKLSIELTNKSITHVVDNSLLPLKKNDKVLILFPEIHLASLVDNANNKCETLNQYLNYDEIIINQDLKNFENIVQKEQKYDKILLVTYNLKKDDIQTKLYEALDKDKLIVISLRSPYDINLLPNCKDYICTYDCTKESLKALANCLQSNVFYGKLPIKMNNKKEEK